jgi:hypothetical protein
VTPASSRWLRRSSPRLSGTLHIRDATGRELAVPLRGKASLLTTGGTGLRGYGEVWAVHTTAPAAETSLMIIYGRTGVSEPASGLCAAGQTIVLDGVTFTWRALNIPTNGVPRQRPAPTGLPRNLRTPPARSSNVCTDQIPAGGLRSRLRNMVRVVTQAARH